MTTALYTERDHNASCALQARTARQAAEAVNELMTLAQANLLLLAMDLFPSEAPAFVQDVFEAGGYPDDQLDQNWLTDAGRATWAVFKAYRGGAA